MLSSYGDSHQLSKYQGHREPWSDSAAVPVKYEHRPKVWSYMKVRKYS